MDCVLRSSKLIYFMRLTLKVLYLGLCILTVFFAYRWYCESKTNYFEPLATISSAIATIVAYFFSSTNQVNRKESSIFGKNNKLNQSDLNGKGEKKSTVFGSGNDIVQ